MTLQIDQRVSFRLGKRLMFGQIVAITGSVSIDPVVQIVGDDKTVYLMLASKVQPVNQDEPLQAR